MEDGREGGMSNNDERPCLKVDILALPVAIAYAACTGRQRLSHVDPS